MLEDLKVPTPEDLRRAHEAYIAEEPRDLLYRVSRDLVEAALAGMAAME